MAATKPWQCPDCPKRLHDPVQAVMDMAISSHVKQHGKTYTPAGGYRPSGPAPSKQRGSTVGDVLEGIGEFFGSIVKGITD